MQFSEITYSEYQRSGSDGEPFSLFFYSPQAVLIEDLHWTAQNVTVDGEPVTMNTDYSDLQPMLDGRSGADPRLVTQYVNNVSDREAEGLVSETEWLSPHYGTTLTWDENWNVMFPKWNAVYSAEGGLDGISLTTADLDGEVSVSVTQPSEERSTPQDWIDRWTSEEFLDLVRGAQSFSVLDSEITGNTASVIKLATRWHGEEFIVVFEAYVPDDGPMIIRRTNATHDNIANIMTLTWGSITADGTSIPHSWTLEDIQALEIE